MGLQIQDTGTPVIRKQIYLMDTDYNLMSLEL
jgi:hypothetical protein